MSDTARTQLDVTQVREGGCACGEHDEAVPLLDVRVIPHAIRHATIFYIIGLVFAVLCVGITWWRYARPGAPKPS